MQPCIGTFHDPPKHAQTTAVFGMALRQYGFDPSCDEGARVGLGMVGPIPLHAIGSLARSAALSRNGRNGIHQGKQLSYIMAIRPGDGGRQRKTLRIGEDMVLRPVFPAIRRIRPGFVPPKTARTLELSTTARDQSIRSAPWRWLRTICKMSCQTPASCQSRSLRQQLIPLPQPISLGKSSQGMPVLSTKRIPVRAFRCEIGGRPPLGYDLRGGKQRSMTAQSSSVSIGLAMCSSSMTNRNPFPEFHHRLSRDQRNRFC